ncbi:hypothetical protein EV356DRAFT_534049 [Viridothelium virens]|uniref:Uncharacterized protein n=1 Tax=Viridothelium virens TaxID=1048519 RepID=A0A6A6H5N9_VIRVR|nr:hypothetical protein EV356DRAFT_534049 [Viridothelium virens]
MEDSLSPSPSKLEASPKGLMALAPELLALIGAHCLSHFTPTVGGMHFANLYGPRNRRLESFASLRLTCRTLNAATKHEFLKTVFRERSFSISYRSLSRLLQISQLPEFAAAIHKVVLCSEPPFIWDVHFAQMYMNNPLSPNQNKLWAGSVLSAGRMSTIDRGYTERSGLDSAMLTKAFSNLPNLSVVEVEFPGIGSGECPSIHKFGSHYLSRNTSIVLSAIGLSGVRLSQFLTQLPSTFLSDQEYYGVAVQELALPIPLTPGLESLRCLRLYLSTRDRALKQFYGDEWNSITSRFLQRMPNLERLHLQFDHWQDTVRLFRSIYRHVELGHLRELVLIRVEVDLRSMSSGGDPCPTFVHFLRLHKSTLQSLVLVNCTLVRGCTWFRLLNELREFSNLKALRLFQISQSRRRVAFPRSECSFETPPPLTLLTRAEAEELQREWVIVEQNDYYAEIHNEIEDVTEKLSHLKQHFQETEKSWRSDDARIFVWH